MEQLMQKLMVSKAIMDKTNNIARGTTQGISLPSTELQNFQPTDAKYNIPQEFLGEAAMSRPTKNPSIPTVDAIKNSKLPDAIKKLMIEHPIVPPQMQTGPTLSNELVEKATRLMKDSKQNNIIPSSTQQQSVPNIPNIEKMVENAVRKVLKEEGLLTESEEKTGEVFSFKVGKHIFEGKVTKIKKLQ
jgi:hypothetical protein